MIVDAILAKLVINTVNCIQLVPSDIPFKESVWAGWYTLPCVDGSYSIIGELEAPLDIYFIGWIDRIVVLVRCAEYSNQLVVCA